ncbi:MAG: thermonuclease family protein [Candidatus Aminicenantes bacterium]|nr:thermonuclease family protein [Candidatus Aminicenantes bacterium]
MLRLKRLTVYILFWGLLPCSSQADHGTVTMVYDGDTVQVRFTTGKREKIRLIGVDAPETDADDKKTRLQAFFAKRFAFKFLYRKQVKIEYDWEKRDKYGRLLAYLWTEDGTFFNEFIIKHGFALAYTRFKYKKEYEKMFLEAEKYANTRGDGLWKKEPFPLIPAGEISVHVGQLISCEFICEKIEDKGNLLLFVSSGNELGISIYKKNLYLFPDIYSWLGNKLIISGLLEEYNQQAQIMLFLPSQIKHH